ncbi:SGNH/GDSL hydrolase family protein [Marivirga sp.]|uniref:SGNH/GDSL hydrolase family protein n=1 Tax=Marivirga sp. TaxID=2018662 RepID=UPI003DA720B6
MEDKKKYHIILILFIFFWQPQLLQGQTEEKRVLFVGNSYTYFWNLPQLVSAMAESQGENFFTQQSTAGGVNWKQHWEGDKELKTQELIKNGDWDVVVLQNHSLSTVRNQEEFFEYGRKLISLVKSTGAQPLLYVTWSREDNPLMQDNINEAYQKLSEETDSELVNIGSAWSRAKQLKPALELYHPDGSHPSPQGSYLTATLFYKKLSGNTVLGIPERLTSFDKQNQKIYLAILMEYDAKFLLQFVEDFNLNTQYSE